MRSIINETKGWLLLILSTTLMRKGVPRIEKKTAKYPRTSELIAIRETFEEHEAHTHREEFLSFIDFIILLYERDEVYRERFDVVFNEIQKSEIRSTGKPRNQWWK